MVDQAPGAPRWITAVHRRRLGWSALALSFVSSGGVQIFLAVTMNVSWPVPVAVATTVMAGGCVAAAVRER